MGLRCLLLLGLLGLAAAWQVIGSISSNTAYGLQIVGNTAYLADGSGGLRIIDVSSPTSMVQLGQLLPGFTGHGRNIALTNDPNVILVCMYHLGISKVNVANPAAPYEVASYQTPVFAEHVVVVGNYALVACHTAGFLVLDVATMGLVATLPLAANGRARYIDVVGNYAYVADGDGGMAVVDITTITAPTLVATTSTPKFAIGMHVHNNIAWVPLHLGDISLFDVSTPTAPVLIQTLSTAHGSVDVWFDAGKAYVSGWDAGMLVFDLTVPTAPVLDSAFLPDPNTVLVGTVVVNAAGVFVCNGWGGLLVLAPGTPPTPAPPTPAPPTPAPATPAPPTPAPATPAPPTPAPLVGTTAPALVVLRPKDPEHLPMPTPIPTPAPTPIPTPAPTIPVATAPKEKLPLPFTP